MAKVVRLIRLLYGPKYLFYTNTATACIVYSAADVTAQLIEHSLSPKATDADSPERPLSRLLGTSGVRFQWDRRRTSVLALDSLVYIVFNFMFYSYFAFIHTQHWHIRMNRGNKWKCKRKKRENWNKKFLVFYAFYLTNRKNFMSDPYF